MEEDQVQDTLYSTAVYGLVSIPDIAPGAVGAGKMGVLGALRHPQDVVAGYEPHQGSEKPPLALCLLAHSSEILPPSMSLYMQGEAVPPRS